MCDIDVIIFNIILLDEYIYCIETFWIFKGIVIWYRSLKFLFRIIFRLFKGRRVGFGLYFIEEIRLNNYFKCMFCKILIKYEEIIFI